MLVISRKLYESVFITNENGDCLITVLNVGSKTVGLLVSQSLVRTPGRLITRRFDLGRDETFRIDGAVSATLIDFAENAARLGITAPPSTAAHRFEVWERIIHENPPPDDGAGGGSAGASVPPPRGPRPPSFEVKREPPQSA